MSENNDKATMGKINESDLVYRQIERINRAGGQIDKEKVGSENGPQRWAHRYQALVNDLYSTVKAMIDEEAIQDLEEKVESYSKEKSLKKRNPFDRKELFEKKKELILKKMSDRNLIFETKTEFEIES
ncbi:MAG: hypothetical protein ABEI13_04540 [Candidatus Paceibacteria bacterium]